jgi:type IV secretion system protein TrbJ
MTRLLPVVAASFIAIAALQAPRSAMAQWTVFDPNNYAQNVLTAARELQQINNQITSLQNEAQMLINQAKNLASLPYSSLRQIEQSIERTQQLLGQAQRIAYDVGQIDRAFTTTYASASINTPDQTLVTNAQTRWQNAVAGLQDAMRVQATVVGNLDTNRTQMSALVTASQGATGALQVNQAGNQLLALQSQQLADLIAAVAAQGRAQAWKPRSAQRPRIRAGSSSGAS